MSSVRSRGPIVIDTDVFSADLVPGSWLAERYASLITGRPAFISFQTVAELRCGAIRRGWGHARMLTLEAKVQRVEVVYTDPDLVAEYAQLRADCEAACHALAHKAHTADRWIAATAIRPGLPLVSNDGIFRGAPGPTARNAPVRLNEPNPGFRMYPFGTRGRLCRVMAPLRANKKV